MCCMGFLWTLLLLLQDILLWLSCLDQKFCTRNCTSGLHLGISCYIERNDILRLSQLAFSCIPGKLGRTLVVQQHLMEWKPKSKMRWQWKNMLYHLIEVPHQSLQFRPSHLKYKPQNSVRLLMIGIGLSYPPWPLVCFSCQTTFVIVEI